MKKTLTSIFIIFLLAGITSQAYATDGTINISGNVLADTCTVSAANGSNNGTVMLPTVAALALATPTDTAGATQFAITLTSCPTIFTKAAAWFEPGSNVDTASGRLINTGTAGNVDVALYNINSNTPIVIGAGSSFGSSGAAFDIVNNAATMNYQASYYAKGAATAGTVIATVNYTVQYQ